MRVPKSTISAYENDRVDIKSSVIVELSKLLETNPNYLLGAVECDADVLDILGVLKKMSPGLKKVALEQIKVPALL
ncbi:MAG: helix-turn-helix transcriptional regulator [Lachnospiraceae bacterium]|nr:helix-turn-helix transcriptional regulator [Lachnospiraceae bacterium]